MTNDYWSSKAYSNAASFVPQLTAKVLQYLDPQAEDHILDVGCGDGVLTEKIAPSCKTLVGLDASSSMIRTANQAVQPKYSNVQFFVADCRRINGDSLSEAGVVPYGILKESSYDKVFSNAAMHWILRDESTRVPFFSDVFRLVKPGGKFVFEMGGFSNVADVHATIYAILRFKCGISIDTIRAADPWFYPSKEWMASVLEGAGFVVETLEMEHRPTKVTEKKEDGSGGVEGWMHLMAASFLQTLNEKDRSDAVGAICEALGQSITKIEDGSQWLNYVRLRAVARRP